MSKKLQIGVLVKKLFLALVVIAALVAIGIKTGVIQMDHPIDA
ncbi:MAG: hypothetical protein QNJ77_11045 [Acidimicrobiia bacterium]|nr:hypothetical protein [Acidimicrobiia bacterium]